ncbi:hypothetical protein EBU94_03780, partial [bacterium]|nr:hypothetical protein [bacterium]
TYFARNFNSGQFSANCVNTTIEIRNPPTVIAGSNVTICEGNTTQLGATAISDKSLTVLTGGTNGCTGGTMFDITVGTTAITLTSFDITPDITGTQTVNVYYKTGTYAGFETNSTAWTLLGSYSITGTADVIVNMPIATLSLLTNTTYGIYLNYNSAYTTGAASISDGLITVTAGVGLCGQFSLINTPRTFNGRVNYQFSPTLSWTPSATLSANNIANPIASPTATTTYTLVGNSLGCQSSSNVTVSVNTRSTSPSISFVPGTICPNTNTTLTATGGIAGTGSSIRWYSATNGGGTLLGTGSSITIPFATTSTVYVRREGTCNNSPDSSRTINIRSYRAISVNSATTPNYCVDNDGWGHWYDSNDEIIFSAKGDFSMCGTGYPSITVSRNPSFTFYNMTQNPTSVCSQNSSPGEMRFEMGRNWNVNLGGASPNGLYSVRFYHLPNEKSDVVTAAIDTMNTLTACGYSYKYNVSNSGWFWFKNINTTYIAPQWEGIQYDGTIGTTVNNVTYVEMDSIPGFSGGSGGVILIPNSVLPLELVNFYGVPEKYFNRLYWITNSERNVSHFEIEKSTNGFDFNIVGYVGAVGNTVSETRYSFVDENPKPGFNYYRLQSVDTDGTKSASNVIVLENINPIENSIFYPIPVDDNIKYYAPNAENSDVMVFVYNSVGGLMQSYSDKIGTDNSLTISFKDYSVGNYVIVIKYIHTNIVDYKSVIKK